MYQVNDLVIYRRNVCKVIEKKLSDVTGEMCYVLEPYEERSADISIQVPVSNRGGHLRSLVTKDEVHELCKRAKDVEPIRSKPANIKSKYQAKMNTDNLDDLVCIIKTTSARNRERMKKNKKLAEVDCNFLKEAENLLYSELALALDCSKAQSKEFFVKQVKRYEEEA